MPNPDQRRARIAEDIRKLSEAMTILAGRMRWACRDVIGHSPRDFWAPAEVIADKLFTLAKDVASGRVELDGLEARAELMAPPKRAKKAKAARPAPPPDHSEAWESTPGEREEATAHAD